MTPQCPICDHDLMSDPVSLALDCSHNDKTIDDNIESALANGVHRFITKPGTYWFYRFGGIWSGYYLEVRHPSTTIIGHYRSMKDGETWSMLCEPGSFDFDPKNPQPLIDLIRLLETYQ